MTALCSREPSAEVWGGQTALGCQDTDESELLCSPSVSCAADDAPASEPVAIASGEELAAELSASLAADSEAMMPTEEDTKVVAAASGVDAAGSAPVKRKLGRRRKNPEARVAPPVKKKERDDVCFVCFDRTNPNLVLCNRTFLGSYFFQFHLGLLQS